MSQLKRQIFHKSKCQQVLKCLKSMRVYLVGWWDLNCGCYGITKWRKNTERRKRSAMNGFSSTWQFRALWNTTMGGILSLSTALEKAHGWNHHLLFTLKVKLGRGKSKLEILHDLLNCSFVLQQNAWVGDKFMNQIQRIAARVPYMTCPGNHNTA